VMGVDVRDAPPIPVDDDLVAEARCRQGPSRPGQPLAERAEQRSGPWAGGHRPHDATVYSAS
jgi:hypothetical protein